ncbi:MAG: hypothetical protein JWN04_6919 [Myxococcaceae bacterium]|nr:hypothetical protein [Myxococcaceae bacterium]
MSVQDVAHRVLHASDFYVLGVSSSPARASLLRRTSKRFPSVSALRDENSRVLAVTRVRGVRFAPRARREAAVLLDALPPRARRACHASR